MTVEQPPEPRIIARPDHSVSRKDIDREALKVMYRLRDAGFIAYLVGGGVRDLYLGKTPKDFDISTNARPGQLRKIFRNSRIIGKRFRLVQVFFRGDKIVEVSTFRQPSEYDLAGAEEVLPSNNTFGSAGDDAFRRDLSINALFYEIENFSIIDYTGGFQDLRDGVVRVIGDADRRVVRDPVRMMRAVRHAARSGFIIEEQTWEAIKCHKDKLTLCPVSRIRDELFKDLQGGASREWAKLSVEAGLFQVIFPFYAKKLVDLEVNPVLDRLLAVFGVIDRLHGLGQKVPEDIMLALICLPWAEEDLNLQGSVRQVKQAQDFSHQLKERLTQNLQHVNIKRLVKEQVAGLIASLPLFLQHAAKESWPKWLSRKSYFRNGLQFCQLYQESLGGDVAAGVEFEAAPVKKATRKRSGKRARSSPSFASRSKGGIFGLKKN